VVGAIAPPAETFSPAPRSGDRGIVDDKLGFGTRPAEFALARLRPDGDGVGVRQLRSVGAGRDSPSMGLLTWRRAPRTRGPSAPSAERAQDPCFRSLALPVGTRAPLRHGPDHAEGLAPREEHRTRAPRAASLRVWFRDVEEDRPKRLALPCRAALPPRLPVSRPSARKRWQYGPSFHGITAWLRRELRGPAVTRPRRAPFGARGIGRDPSIEGVQPSCQRSAPGLRLDSLTPDDNRTRGGCRGSRRFTRFDPRIVRRSGVLFRRGDRPTSLWCSWFLLGRPALQRQPATEAPRPFDRPAA